MSFFQRLEWSALLEKWLVIGLSWWLVGMLVLPTSKLYHQGMVLFLWLPGVLALVTRGAVVKSWQQPIAAILALFALWSALSIIWAEVSFEISELKIFLYVFLTANAVIALRCISEGLFLRTLAFSGLVVGFFAWVSLGFFYGVEGLPWRARAVGTGLVNHPILGAQVFGAMGIVLLYLRRRLPSALQEGAWYVACAGCLAFLFLSQSKGPWLAALGTLLLSPLWGQDKRQWLLTLLGVLTVFVVVVFFPQLIFQRGFSYRPELLAQAMLQLEHRPWLGLGLGSPYWLWIESLQKSFEHVHNIYMHIAITLGLIGLAGWIALQGLAFATAWRGRYAVEGRMLCTLICFAALALFTDGIGPWVKPREEWFCLWMPVFLCMSWAAASYVRRALKGGAPNEMTSIN